MIFEAEFKLGNQLAAVRCAQSRHKDTTKSQEK
jgi:hypothetical protein